VHGLILLCEKQMEEGEKSKIIFNLKVLTIPAYTS
jgi:hypothetical protein